MKAIRAIGQVRGADVLAGGKDSMWRCSSNADTPWLVICPPNQFVMAVAESEE
jgi:hypothetical protein